ncbi:SDR family oxidoreductase [Mongoliimonas terrestris]|uniref:SDR family oxidoreductase n=1 Tax=Mongoliimonas terrestris TaxID=1709001 RepID=UPI0009497A5C|nr:SDR family oxidoreductase [Mongoliimonas terrestris]
MSSRFQDQVVVITGGSSGIGLATAHAFAAEGARRVYITGRNAAALAEAAAAIGPSAVTVRGDAGTVADLDALAETVRANGDRVDVLFANAGIAEPNSFGETNEATFDKTFDINVKGVFFTVQSLLPLLKDGASVVLNASIVANKGMAGLSLYNASKAAVRSFARTLANDLKARGIRVNALSPGATRTPIMKTGLGMSEDAIKGFEDYVAGAAPAGRFGRPEEIADAVLFLGSAAATYVNGVELSVDGGFGQV